MRDLTPICLGFLSKVSCRGGALPRCWLGSLGNTASEDEDGDENGSYHQWQRCGWSRWYLHSLWLCNFQLFVLPFSWLLHSLQFHSGEKAPVTVKLACRGPLLLCCCGRRPCKGSPSSWSLFYWWCVSTRTIWCFLLFAGTRGCSSDLWIQDPEHELWLPTLSFSRVFRGNWCGAEKWNRGKSEHSMLPGQNRCLCQSQYSWYFDATIVG